MSKWILILFCPCGCACWKLKLVVTVKYCAHGSVWTTKTRIQNMQPWTCTVELAQFTQKHVFCFHHRRSAKRNNHTEYAYRPSTLYNPFSTATATMLIMFIRLYDIPVMHWWADASNMIQYVQFSIQKVRFLFGLEACAHKLNRLIWFKLLWSPRGGKEKWLTKRSRTMSRLACTARTVWDAWKWATAWIFRSATMSSRQSHYVG